ncbi:carbamoyl phosphate synthase large subunit, partial [Kitasatospora sp. NPDC057595]
GVDTVLGPEMRSTGEVMGLDRVFGTAYAKSQSAAQLPLPVKGRVVLSVADRDKRDIVLPALALAGLGFELLATAGTAEVLRRAGVPVTVVRKHSEGEGPDGEQTVDRMIHDGAVDLVVITGRSAAGPAGRSGDGYLIRTAAVARAVPCLTTVQAMGAAVQGIDALQSSSGPTVTPLQELRVRYDRPA